MLVKWNSFPATLFSELENAFWRDTVVEFAPRVDVSEGKDKFTVRAELPGVSREQVKITVENDVLTLSGEKRYSEDKQESNYRLREAAYGKFERRFRLGNNLDREHITADYKDGVLEITLPKSAQAQSKEIAIKVK